MYFHYNGFTRGKINLKFMPWSPVVPSNRFRFVSLCTWGILCVCVFVNCWWTGGLSVYVCVITWNCMCWCYVCLCVCVRIYLSLCMNKGVVWHTCVTVESLCSFKPTVELMEWEGCPHRHTPHSWCRSGTCTDILTGSCSNLKKRGKTPTPPRFKVSIACPWMV